ncbi:MAG: ankyrin repeat domain-containing protein, partial [Verrucomicrobia bacterium]|nr:ankyrin repeat domain-containing protein [Verrucomicrobiota bacterium]
MKTKLLVLIVAFVVVSPVRAADASSDALQQGLFEEEANHDLDAAIRAYQSVAARYDEQRKLAATAVFRLGECYRKLGKTNEANAQYQRVLRDFADQPQLVKLSREYLGPAAASSATAAASIPGAPPPIVADGQNYFPATEEERNELLRIIATAKDSPDLVNGKDQADWTPLHSAAHWDHIAVAQYLVAHGAEVNSRTGDGRTPLELATSSGHRSMAELLLEHGADVNAKNPTGATPLFFAVRKNFLQMARLLLGRGAEVDLVGSSNGGTPTDSFGTSCPLFLASRLGELEMVRLLLEHKADVNLKSEFGRTPLFAVSLYGNENLMPNADQVMILKLLLERGATVNARDNNGATPLDGCESPVLAKMLLEKGADPNATPDVGTPPIISALFHDSSRVRLDLVRLLVRHSAEVNKTNQMGQTALTLAIITGSKDVAAFLLQHGADVSVKDNAGHTALWNAVVGLNADLARLLLENGADPNQPLPMSKNENLPLLHLAIVERGVPRMGGTGGVNGSHTPEPAHILRVVSVLLDFKADVNARDANGRTALSWAVNYGLNEVVTLLLQHHADINAKDNNGDTPLLKAAVSGRADLAQLLIDHGADVNAKNSYGWTAILYAIHRGDKAVVELLIAAGADLKFAALPYSVGPRTPAPLALTPLEFAVELAHGRIPAYSNDQKEGVWAEIADYLRQHGGVE